MQKLIDALGHGGSLREKNGKNGQFRWCMWCPMLIRDMRTGEQKSCPSRGGNQAGTRCVREVTRRHPDGDISVTSQTALWITQHIQKCISLPTRRNAVR